MVFSKRFNQFIERQCFTRYCEIYVCVTYCVCAFVNSKPWLQRDLGHIYVRYCIFTEVLKNIFFYIKNALN